MANIKNLLKAVQENIPLAPYTTFKIGGPARYFYVAKNTEDIKQAAQVVKELKLAYYVLGNGSNVLVSDQGFNGLVIKILNTKYEIRNTNIFCDSGVSLGKLVNETVKNGLTGLEWLIGIPGTLGGAIYGNAGAFGYSLGEAVESVKVLNPENLTEEILAARDCHFGYRTSRFHSKADQSCADREKKYIILSAILKLKKGDKSESEKITREYIAKRSTNHPVGPSAGSVFKNPLIKENQKSYDRLLRKFPEVEKFKVNGKIPVGWLIEEVGVRGKKIGGAAISKTHGNFIINIGEASAEDVIILISLIKQKIRVNFGICLEEEIQYVGF